MMKRFLFEGQVNGEPLLTAFDIDELIFNDPNNISSPLDMMRSDYHRHASEKVPGFEDAYPLPSSMVLREVSYPGL